MTHMGKDTCTPHTHSGFERVRTKFMMREHGLLCTNVITHVLQNEFDMTTGSNNHIIIVQNTILVQHLV